MDEVTADVVEADVVVVVVEVVVVEVEVKMVWLMLDIVLTLMGLVGRGAEMGSSNFRRRRIRRQ